LLEQISKTSNCAMIFISHEQEDIPKFFDLEISLQNGEVSFLGNRFKK
jgi:ABC-type molybdenum transport system ATPase subunit/photorepair protein PhrA